MRNDRKSASGIEHHKPSMIVGAAMMGAAFVIGVCGVVTGGTAAFAAIRQWLSESDMTATEMAKHRMDQGKATAAATASAWRHHEAASPQRVRT